MERSTVGKFFLRQVLLQSEAPDREPEFQLHVFMSIAHDRVLEQDLLLSANNEERCSLPRQLSGEDCGREFSD
jgi:hypothetical protein